MLGKRVFHVVLLFVVSALWGINYFLIQYAEQTIPPLSAMVLRVLAAGAVMLIIVVFFLKRDLRPLATHWRLFIVMGFLAVAIFWLALAFGVERVSASLATLITTSVPVFTLLITVFLLHQDRFTGRRLLGLVLAPSGIALFIGSDLLTDRSSELFGIAIVASGFLAYAINGIIAAAHRNEIDPFVMATGTVLYGSIYLIPLMFIFEAPFGALPSVTSLLSIGASGVLCTALGYLIYFFLVDRISALFASLYGYFTPVFAVFFGNLLLGDRFTWHHVLGATFAVAGAFLVNWQSHRSV